MFVFYDSQVWKINSQITIILYKCFSQLHDKKITLFLNLSL